LFIFINLECGNVFSIGYNYFGCIGDGTDYDSSKIKQIDYFKNVFIEDVVCSETHCLSISNKGEIYGWGDNSYGQLGNGKSGRNEKQLIPIKIFKI
jgi:alpha-tubulin suppressor-like RCC1 family protein